MSRRRHELGIILLHGCRSRGNSFSDVRRNDALSTSLRTGALWVFAGLMGVNSLGCDRKDSRTSSQTEGAPLTPPVSRAPTSRSYEDDDLALEALGTSTCAPEPPFLPPAGHERISVKIRVASKSVRPVPVQALAFRVEGRDEKAFAATLAGCKSPLSVATLSQGQRAEGDVAFDVPESHGPLDLVYEPFLLGRPPVSVRVRIPETPRK
jgi:Domain of unknown function (DUF4352)